MGRKSGRTHVYIGEERKELVDKSHINLSSFVREKIDEELDE